MDQIEPKLPARRIGISTICAGLITGIALFSVNVPGQFEQWCWGKNCERPRYAHGWPYVFLERNAGLDESVFWDGNCWALTAEVVCWSPALLAVNCFCAFAIIAILVVLVERWRVRPGRLSISLRSALVSVAILSALMWTGGRWVVRQRQFARVAVERSWTMEFSGPTWLGELIARSTGRSPTEWHWFIRPLPEVFPFPTATTDDPDDVLRLERLLTLMPNEITLELVGYSSDPRNVLCYLDHLSACRHLRFLMSKSRVPLTTPLINGLPHLESLDLMVHDEADPLGSFTHEALVSLVRPAKVRGLTAPVVAIQLDELLPLRRFTNLQCVDLSCYSDCDMDLEALTPFAQLQSLRSLRIVHGIEPRIELVDVSPLEKCRRLEQLEFAGFKIDLEDIDSLARCGRLMDLTLADADLTEAAVDHLVVLRGIANVWLHDLLIDGELPTGAQIANLRARFSNVHILN